MEYGDITYRQLKPTVALRLGEFVKQAKDNQMNSVRAFVGHSFMPEDESVVRAFTNYLDTLAESQKLSSNA